MAEPEFSEEDLLAHVRGLAPADLTARITARAEVDAGLRAQIAVMAGLRPALQSLHSGPVPGNFGWTRLQRAVEAERVKTVATPATREPSYLRIAATILGIAVLAQGAYIAQGWRGGDDRYRTASDPAAEFVLGLAFAPEATAADVQTLLRDAGAQIVDGPSAMGLYRVAFDDATARDAAETVFAGSALVALVAQE